MGMIRSIAGNMIGSILSQRSYWAAKRTDGKWLCELDLVDDGKGGKRTLDWTLDLASAGDLARPGIKELWLFCPPSLSRPLGSSDFFHIDSEHPGFQLKVGLLYAWGMEGRKMEAQLIGRIESMATGECDCKIWDAGASVFGDWHSNIHAMGAWREGVAPLGALDLNVLGVR